MEKAAGVLRSPLCAEISYLDRLTLCEGLTLGGSVPTPLCQKCQILAGPGAPTIPALRESFLRALVRGIASATLPDTRIL